jgi:NAD(P)-dependent dehydrogenase (short-subunit alcohol dehydrogenase family)
MTSYPAIAPENGRYHISSAMMLGLCRVLRGSFFPTGATFTWTIHTTPYPFLKDARHVGHRVLVTGGTRGIGRSLAVAFAGAGAASIAVADISEDFDKLAHDMITAAQANEFDPPQIILHKLDVADEESVRKCAALITEEFKGGLDVLVNNAGFMTPALPVPKSDTPLWWRTMEVNLKGPYLMGKYFVPLLLSAPGGPQTIINISSVAAHNLRPMASAYGTSKFAVLKLTEFLLVEAAEKGLVAYSVHPGGVLTELAEKGMPSETLGLLTDSPELPAATIVWLSSQRRDWLSGRYISATWDMEELMARKEEIVKGDKLKVRLVV